MSAPSVRQRHLKGESTAKTTPTTSASNVLNEVEDASPVISVLDIIRIIFTLCAASCALSYYTTSGESLLWGYRPWLTRPQLVKAFFVSYAQNYHVFSLEAGALAQISLTAGCAEWTCESYTLPIIQIQWLKPRPSYLSRYQWHHLRRFRRPPHLWPWW